MSMYYNITLDNKTIFENTQGKTCAELYDFLEEKFGTPTLKTYTVPAIEVAQFFANRHEPVNDTFDGTIFNPNDNLYYDSWIHFDRGTATGLTDEEKIENFKNAKMLFGEAIDETSQLIITIE